MATTTKMEDMVPEVEAPEIMASPKSVGGEKENVEYVEHVETEPLPSIHDEL